MVGSSIGIIVPGVDKGSSIFLFHLSKILSSIFERVYLVGREIENVPFSNVLVLSIRHKGSNNVIRESAKYALLQAHMSYKINKMYSYVDTWIFFLGGEALILPILTARLLNKKVIILLVGSIEREGRHRKDSRYKLLGFFKKVCCNLTTTIIVYSKNLIPFLNLEEYRHKILIAHEHFLDCDSFTVTTRLANRPPLIGYIGRMSEEKGVRPFVQALPSIIGHYPDLRVLIGGNGQLMGLIEASLKNGGLISRVDLPGWISHENLPKYLNQLRLLVLPSYSEGLPNIVLEAMSCGTPVLASPVGAIPDIIIDGQTGFIMESNDPDCIAKNVIRALNSPELEHISENGRMYVEENYSFEDTVARWKEVFSNKLLK